MEGSVKTTRLDLCVREDLVDPNDKTNFAILAYRDKLIALEHSLQKPRTMILNSR